MAKTAKTVIGVMGPGSGATPDDCRQAFRLGQRIAQEGWVLLTGGRCEGVMDAASRGAQDAQGLVVGVLPGVDRTSMSTAVDIPIITGMGHARNVINVLSSTAVVACGIGLGTASEVALALKSEIPVILLSADDRAYQFFKETLSVPFGASLPAQTPPGLLRQVSTPECAIKAIYDMRPGLQNSYLPDDA